MAVNSKVIKRRIKSVSSTKKITKAMEMVAASKMRKAVDTALRTRTYAKLAWEILVDLSQNAEVNIPLLEVRPVKNVLVILVTSNRGLCGSFNSNIIKKTSLALKTPDRFGTQTIDGKILKSENVNIDVLGIGKKGAEFAKRNNYNLVASYTTFSDTPSLKDILPISQMVMEQYEKKVYDKVVVAYTDFKSAIAQTAKLKQVLPISKTDLETMLIELGEEDVQKNEPVVAAKMDDYLFEPNPQSVLETVLPRLVETQLLQATLESSASEHSARMMAMRNASDAAVDMIAELNLNFNKARQAAITQEIAEIAGGAAALD